MYILFRLSRNCTALILFSDRWSGITQNLGFRFWKCHGKMGLMQGFFCQIFDIFDDFSKWNTPKTHCETLKNHQIYKIFGKKWRKALFNLPWTHLLADSVYPKIQFRVADPATEGYFFLYQHPIQFCTQHLWIPKIRKYYLHKFYFFQKKKNT